MSKLRILNLVVQPILVEDDGKELKPGPTVQPIVVHMSQLSTLAEELALEVKRLQG